MNRDETVLVTGGSGFIASYCIGALLHQGFRVRASLRSLRRADDVRAMLTTAGITDLSALSFVEADLSDAGSWEAAAAGCAYVIHPASPTPHPDAKTEAEFVVPAVDGVLNVMRAAKRAGVKRVVLTSAFGAVGMGTDKQTPYTEEDWTVLRKDVAPYQKSKTLSEKAAWNFIAGAGQGMELAVVNPVGVLGPVLGADFSHSIGTIKNMLGGTMKGLPDLRFAYVDVRDVADLHLRAMLHPAAAGHRFIATADGTLSLAEIAAILKESFGTRAANVPTRRLPSWLVRVIARFNPTVRLVVPFLGMAKAASHDKATRVLDWHLRSSRDAVIATGESLLRLGLV